MAAPTKKRMTGNKETKMNDDDDAELVMEDKEENEDEEDELINSNINVEFEARNAEHFDFHGIRKLLIQLLLKANVDVSELANEIIAQNYVGSVIKQVDVSGEEGEDSDDNDDGEGDVFGIITALDLSAERNMNCIDQLRSLLQTRCSQLKDAKLLAKLNAVLNSDEQRLAFIINERFINIPPQIALPSFDSLWKEIDRAKQKKKMPDFANYIMIAKTYNGKVQKVQNERIFVNADEETFFENADLTFDYSVRTERDTGMSDQWDVGDDELDPMRTVIILSADKIPVVMQRLRTLLS